jgi:heptosyltransferase-3
LLPAPCSFIDESLSRILVIRGGAIGDFILTLPALKLLREAFPSAHLEVLGYKHIAVLATMSGYANGTRSIEHSSLSSFFSRDGDLAPGLVDYFGSFQQVISYFFDPDRIFADNLKRAGVRHLLVGSPKMTDQEHAARQLARPLESLALYLDDPAAIIAPHEVRRRDRSVIAIHPGSGSESKNWPLQRWVEVARSLLLSNESTRLFLIGGEADHDRVAQLRAACPNERVRVAQDLPLADLAVGLRECGLFLGHDSGISHLAAAVGTPCLLLFGPTDPAIWAPANPDVRVLRTPGLTMDGISVEQVLAHL